MTPADIYAQTPYETTSRKLRAYARRHGYATRTSKPNNGSRQGNITLTMGDFHVTWCPVGKTGILRLNGLFPRDFLARMSAAFSAAHPDAWKAYL